MKRYAPYFIVIALVVIVGVGSFISAENQMKSQNAEITLLQKTINKNNDQIAKLTKTTASQSAKIKDLQNAPTPTPVIETHYVSQSTSQSTVPTPTLTEQEAAAAIALKLMEESAQHTTVVQQSPQRSTCIAAGSELNCTSN